MTTEPEPQVIPEPQPAPEPEAEPSHAPVPDAPTEADPNNGA